MMGLSLAQELELISEELDQLRFAGMDQNPKGIRDRLGWCASAAKRQENRNPRPVWAGPCSEIGMDGKPVPVMETFEAFQVRLAKWENEQ